MAAGSRSMGTVPAALVVIAALLRYYAAQVRSPRLRFRSGAAARLLLACKHLLRDHWPHVLLEASGVVASAAALARIPPLRRRTRIPMLVSLPDGGTARLVWEHPPGGQARARGVVLLLPGLNNSSYTPFIQHTAAYLTRRRGFTVATLDYRGVGGLALTSRRVGVSDSWRDLPAVLDAIRAHSPEGKPILGVGYSMGGLILCKHLAVYGDATPIAAAVSISAPLDLVKCTKTLESKPLLNAMLALGVRLNVARHGQMALSTKESAALRSAWSLRQVEEAFVVERNGYRTASEYHRVNTPDMSAVARPLLTIYGRDDPLVAPKDLPDAMAENPFILSVTTRKGGHIGWTSGPISLPCGPTWADRAAATFLDYHVVGRAPSVRRSAPTLGLGRARL